MAHRLVVSGRDSAHTSLTFAAVGQITRGLRILARELSEKASAEGEERKPVPLWITGHSLGAALAGLSYARYLHKPKDLGSNIVLRDAYTFGGQSRQ